MTNLILLAYILSIFCVLNLFFLSLRYGDTHTVTENYKTHFLHLSCTNVHYEPNYSSVTDQEVAGHYMLTLQIISAIYMSDFLYFHS